MVRYRQSVAASLIAANKASLGNHDAHLDMQDWQAHRFPAKCELWAEHHWLSPETLTLSTQFFQSESHFSIAIDFCVKINRFAFFSIGSRPRKFNRNYQKNNRNPYEKSIEKTSNSIGNFINKSLKINRIAHSKIMFFDRRENANFKKRKNTHTKHMSRRLLLYA